MKILAIDTSTEACSAALWQAGEVCSCFKLAPQKHARLILPMINTLLAEAGLSLSQLSALSVTKGPGSFTGLRIGAGVVQGLAFAADLPVVMVSTLRVLAQGARRKFSSSHVLSVLDARMRQVYYGGYALNDSGLMEEVIADQVCDPQEVLIPSNGEWVGIGSGWGGYRSLLEARFQDRVNEICIDCYPEAEDLLVLAGELFRVGEVVTAEEVLPVYLRDKVV